MLEPFPTNGSLVIECVLELWVCVRKVEPQYETIAVIPPVFSCVCCV